MNGFSCYITATNNKRQNLMAAIDLSFWKGVQCYPLTRANTQNVSFQISLLWPIHITNAVDKTKLSTT